MKSKFFSLVMLLVMAFTHLMPTATVLAEELNKKDHYIPEEDVLIPAEEIPTEVLEQTPIFQEVPQDEVDSTEERDPWETVGDLPSQQDGTKIETLNLEWLTPDDKEDDNKNVLSQVWHTNDDLKNVRFRIAYALSGQHSYPAGTIRMTLPKQIFKDRTGNYIGDFSLAVPEAPDSRGLFSYTEYPEEIVITNTKDLASASSGFIEGRYNNLKPSQIFDESTGYVSEPTRVRMEILTHDLNVLGKVSESLTAKVDTKAAVTQARNLGVVVRESYPDDFPEELNAVIENKDEYVYATFNSEMNYIATQYFNVNVKHKTWVENTSGERLAEGIILGFRDNRTGQVFTDGQNSELSRDIFNNDYTSTNFYTNVYVAFPKENFDFDVLYHLKDEVTYTLTSQDDKEVTRRSDTDTLQYMRFKFLEPEGHFWATKEGGGSSRVFVNRKNQGVYTYALNQLRKGQPVHTNYHVGTKSFGFPWTVDPNIDVENSNTVDHEKLEFYGKIPYKVILDDGDLKLENTNEDLNLEDAYFRGVRFNTPNIYDYVQFQKDGYGYYENYDKQVLYGKRVEGQYGYQEIKDRTKIPEFTVYADTPDGSTLEMAKVNFQDGIQITPLNGAEVIGNILYFGQEMKHFRVETETTLAAIIYSVDPLVTIKPSEKILKAVEESTQPIVNISNEANFGVELYGNYKQIRKDKGINQLKGFASGAEISKNLTYKNLIGDRNVRLSYTGHFKHLTNQTIHNVLEEAINEGIHEKVTSGTWYDLLPEGVTPDTSTINASKHVEVTDIEVIENFRDSGRMLLKIDVNIEPNTLYSHSYNNIIEQRGLFDQHSISFEANTSWERLHDLGNQVNNQIVFEANVESLGTVTNAKGEPDNPVFGNHRHSKGAVGDDAEILTDLNPDHDKPVFLYANNNTTLDADTAAITSVTKRVDVNGEGLYGDGLDNYIPKNVYSGGMYQYRIRVQAPEVSSATKNIVLYDHLENYKPTDNKDEGDTQWKGKFRDIDVSHLESMGAKPVVYYSTKKNLILDNENNTSDNDLSQDHWTTERPQLDDITAIAIDVSKTPEGVDFVLKEGEAINIYIKMQAPVAESPEWYDTRLEEGQTEEEHGGHHAYNNTVMISRQVSPSGIVGDPLLVRNDYTKVGLKPYKVKVNLEWEDDNNRDGIRPETLDVRIYANGVPTEHHATLTLPELSQLFEKLTKTNEKGQDVKYTVVIEENVEGYRFVMHPPKVSDDITILDILGIHEPEKKVIQGQKLWEEPNALERPEEITVNLIADGTVIDRKIVRAPNWSYDFGPQYINRHEGVPIEYRITESDVPGYISTSEGYNLKNTYYPYGDLTLTKEIVNPTERSKDKTFTFELTLRDRQGEPLTGAYIMERKIPDLETNVNIPTERVTNGSIITLKEGQTLTIKDIPYGSTYQLNEKELPGFTLDSRSRLSGTIKAGQTSKAKAINRYISRGQFFLEVEKTLENKELENRQFTFDVFTPEGKIIRTATNQGNKVMFGGIRVDTNDLGESLEFIIRERNAGKPGYTYDEKEIKAVVTLDDQGDGTISTNIKYSETPVFKNIYRAEGEIEFVANKVIRNDFDMEQGQFNFELVDVNTGKVVSTGTNDEEGLIKFTPVKYTEQDIGKQYVYEAREIIPEEPDPKMTYDKTKVRYDVEVFDNGDGTLSFDSFATDLYTEDVGNSERTPVFVNEYKPGSLQVTKRVNGDYDPTEEFKFKVKLTGEDGTVPEGDFELKREEAVKPIVIKFEGEGVLPDDIVINPDKVMGLPGEKIYQSLELKYPEGYNSPYLDIFTLKGTGEVILDLGSIGTYSFYNKGSDTVEELELDPFIKPIINPEIREYILIKEEGILYHNTIFYSHKNMDNVDSIEDFYDNLTFITLHENGDLILRPANGKKGYIGVDNLGINLNDPLQLIWAEEKFQKAMAKVGNPLNIKIKGNVVAKRNLSGFFKDLDNIQSIDLTGLDTSQVEDFREIFMNTRSIKTLNVSTLDTSSATIMDRMFYGLKSIKELDISNFNTSKVNSMNNMFTNMESLTNINLTGLDTSNVESFWGMFYNNKNLKELDLSHFNTSKATNIGAMFTYMENLEKLDISNFDTQHVTNMTSMLYNTYKLKDLDLSHFDTRKLQYANNIFFNSGLESLDLTGWDTRNLIGSENMFHSNDLKEVKVGENFVILDEKTVKLREDLYSQNGTGTDIFHTPGVKTPGTYAPKNIVDSVINKEVNRVKSTQDVVDSTSNVLKTGQHGMVTWTVYDDGLLEFKPTNGVKGTLDRTNSNRSTRPWYSYRNQITSVYISSGVIANTNSGNLFAGLSRVTKMDIKNLDTKNVTNMSYMFRGMSNLTSLDISNFNTQNVTNMGYMFSGMSNLTSLDLSNFNTQNVRYMGYMFSGMSNLTSLDLSNFNTQNVTSMGSMFSGMSNLTSLDLSNFNTQNVTSMGYMFSGMSNLTSLDLSNFNTQNVTSMGYMFYRLNSLNQIHLSPQFKFQSNAKLPKNIHENYTGKWIRQDRSYGPYTPEEHAKLYNQNPEAMAGIWNLEKETFEYTVSYKTTQGNGEIPNQVLEKDKPESLSQKPFYRFGYRQIGWARTQGAETPDYALGETVTNIGNVGDHVVLYPVWQALDNKVSIKDGEFEFTLRAGESVTIPDIPAGIAYEVYEETKDGWVVVNTQNTQNTIKPLETEKVLFVNEYNPNLYSFQINGRKYLNGKLASGHTFELLKDGEVIETIESVNGFIQTKPVIYEERSVYELREQPSADSNIIDDTRVYTITAEKGQVTYTDSTRGQVDDIVFHNTTRPGSLTITKEVTGTETKKPFTIEVSLSDRPTQTVTLNAGESHTINNIPSGTRYQVRELNIPKGYVLEGITNAEGIIQSETVNVTVKNAYQAQGSFNLQARKILENKDLEAGQFTFAIYDENHKEITRTENDAEGNIYFDAITVTRPGEHTYTLIELVSLDPNIVYDPTPRTLIVNAVDNGNGDLTVEYDEPNITWTNKYVNEIPEDSKVVPINIKKEVINLTEASKNKPFDITVEFIKEGQPLTETFEYESNRGSNGLVTHGQTLQIKHDETITIKNMLVGAEVKVTETVPKGFTNENPNVTLIVQDTEETQTVHLENVYQTSGELVLSGQKYIENGNIENFRFNFLMLHEGKIISQSQNNSDGVIHFDPILYDHTDDGKTYTYTIIEDHQQTEGITYDDKEIKFDVTVKDNGDGTMSITTTLGDNEIVFNNLYRNPEQQMPMTGGIGTIIIVLVAGIGLFIIYKRRN